jgi:menaquinone-specific isochorismate synthase
MRATTVALTDDVDLNDVCRGDGVLFVRDGVGFAGRGIAARADASTIASVLSAIEHDDRVGGVSPVALGWFSFMPGGPSSFVVPAVTVGKTADGQRFVTTIDGADEQLTAAAPPATAHAFHVRPVTPVDQYLRAVRAAREAVRNGHLHKAVIAREVEVLSDAPIDVHAVLRRLKASFGSSYRYCIDGLVGASPELLVAVEGSTVRSHPLAGTTARSGDPHVDAAAAAALLASVKDQVEHRVVIDMIHDTLLPWCSYLDWEPDPSVVAVANVQHLATRMEGRLSGEPAHVLQLAAALCPTPALGGLPRTEALALIADVEGFDRGRYGGAVGWVNAGGEGTFAVTIRCAEMSDGGQRARLVAGGGIVARSEPLAELAETQVKLQAMLSAIVRG